jgi:hypothetical protein
MTADDDRRIEHRPTDVAALAREAAALRRQGLHARDIGDLLGIGLGAAAWLLRWPAEDLGSPLKGRPAGHSACNISPAPAASETISFRGDSA